MGIKLAGIRQKLFINWFKLKEYSKNRIDYHYRKLLPILNKLGRNKIMEFNRWITPRVKSLSFNIFKISLEGMVIFIAVSGIFYPYHIIHQIFAYGLSLYIISRIMKRLWVNYIRGRLILMGEINETSKEMFEEIRK